MEAGVGHLVFILQLWARRFMDLTGRQPLALHWEPRREMKELRLHPQGLVVPSGGGLCALRPGTRGAENRDCWPCLGLREASSRS